MVLIYNVNRSTLRRLGTETEEIYLTDKESKLIEVLCGGTMCTWYEMTVYVYKKYNRQLHDTLYLIKHRLSKKANLNIKTICKHGIILKDLIYIEKGV